MKKKAIGNLLVQCLNKPAPTTVTTGALIDSATAKTTPVDADYVGLMDSAASNILKKLSWANLKATLKTYFDTLYGVQTAADQTARLALTGLPLGARVKQTDNGFWYELRVSGGESTAGNWRAEPKVYKALLSQTGTDAPVATVLENTLGGTVVWTRSDVGDFRATLASAFPSGKTFAPSGLADGGLVEASEFFVRASWLSADVVQFINADAGFVLTDGLGRGYIEIRVYP